MATCASPIVESEPDSDSGYEYDPSVNPSIVADRYWVWSLPPWEDDAETYGKWLVFKTKATGELDHAWHTIAQCVTNGEFGEGCTGAKCSTALENPDEAPVGSPNGVICVYTTKEAMDAVGLLLIQKVRQTMRYKTNETTLAGKYAHKGHGKVTTRTLYWNDGQPIFGPRTLSADVNPTSIIDYPWVTCTPPSATDDATVAGRWMVFVPLVSLDETWHRIRRAVESGEFGSQCIRAKCSTLFRPDHLTPDSDGLIKISTTEEGMEEVGMKLISKVEHNIQYRRKKVKVPPQKDRYYKERMWLYWNNGEPSLGHCADVNPTSVTDDHWVHCQPSSALADGAHDNAQVHGKWQIFEPMVSLDETWHTIRRAVESGEFGNGCIVARCSTALRPKNKAPDSDGVIEISTTKEGMEEVGLKLINKVERDIQYQYEDIEAPPGANRYRSERPEKTRLYWNDGKPSFNDSANPTSITGKHWVHCKSPSAPPGDVGAYGKWQIYEPMASLDKTWHTIRRAVESGELGNECIDVRCSTARNQKNKARDSDGVIEISTTKEGMDEVGMKLISKVERDIQYQHEDHFQANRSRRRGQTKTQLYWNNGKPSYNDSAIPTSISDKYWVLCKPPSAPPGDIEAYGKWQFFEPMKSLNEMWYWIKRAVERGEFDNGCISARCSTALKPDYKPPDSDGVIEISTTKEGMDEVGLKLINKVERDIQYRYEDHPQRGPMKTRLYWNDGKPSYNDIADPTHITDKQWVHCNPTSAPAGVDHGKWQIFEPMVSLDETWHTIRRAVESGEFGNGCIVARCSTALKPKHMAPDSDGMIEISTTGEGMDEVGLKLINKVERDIFYQHREVEGPHRADRHRGKPCQKTRLYWNSGEPSSIKV